MEIKDYDVVALRKNAKHGFEDVNEYKGTYSAKSSHEAMEKLCEEYKIRPDEFNFSSLTRNNKTAFDVIKNFFNKF